MSKEHPAIYCIRRGSALYPEFEADREWVERQPAGQRIKVSLHTGRSPAKLGWYWAMLSKLVKATECAASAEALHEAVKLELGFTQRVRINGMTLLVPGSIAFGKMTEAEFDEYLERVVQWVAQEYGVTPADLFNDNKER